MGVDSSPWTLGFTVDDGNISKKSIYPEEKWMKARVMSSISCVRIKTEGFNTILEFLNLLFQLLEIIMASFDSN